MGMRVLWYFVSLPVGLLIFPCELEVAGWLYGGSGCLQLSTGLPNKALQRTRQIAAAPLSFHGRLQRYNEEESWRIWPLRLRLCLPA
jgi:hypothetical protein